MNRILKSWKRTFTCMMTVMLIALGLPAALSADVGVPRKEAGLQSYPVEDNVTIYKGALVCVNESGYIVPAADTDGYRFKGVSYENVDNTITGHSQGGLNVRVLTDGVHLLTATSITQAMVGRYVYVVDDATFDESSTNKICVGRLVEYVSTTSGWVDIGQRQDLKGYGDHLHLQTDETKTVRINNKTFMGTSGDETGLRVAPRQGVTTTGSIRGIECIPGGSAAASAFGFANLQGVISECYGNTVGDITGIVAAFEGKVDMPSGYPGTVTGPVSILRCFNDMHGTVTNGVFVMDIATHGGNKAWDGLAKLPDDDQIASYDEAGTSGTKAGWIKVKIGSATRYIRTYDSGA